MADLFVPHKGVGRYMALEFCSQYLELQEKTVKTLENNK